MANTIGEVRRSQLITTYGVGAVIAVENESFMVAGLDLWTPSQDLEIHEPRLERLLNVSHFLLPPATDTDKSHDIPVVRFPNIYQCPHTHELDEHYRLATFWDQNDCSDCGAKLVPSRFVMACDAGHIDDFPYFYWVHAGHERTGKHHLSMSTLGVTASLADIVISCSCGVSRSMDGAFDRDALKGVRRCTGRRPWLGGDPEQCDRPPRVLQRGASNVWFPVYASALSIPPWSEAALKLLNRHWTVIEHVPDEVLPQVLEGMGLAEAGAFTIEDLVMAVRQRRAAEEPTEEDPDVALRQQEYEALTRGRVETSTAQDFVCVPASGMTQRTSGLFDTVMIVRRLREVRALYGFTRLDQTSESARQAPLALDDVHWLPAIEVIGEGVFLHLDEGRLRDWEKAPEVVARAARLEASAGRTTLGRETQAIRVTPRFLAVHTLAHVLINQWALDSGYPSASLRERLFVTDTHAALLIYTATSDSAGSLGGVVGQAEPRRLEQTLTEALQRAAWCSADPLCLESEPSGADALNLAACHSCALLPETSCEVQNTFLDRIMLIGSPDGVRGLCEHWTG